MATLADTYMGGGDGSFVSKRNKGAARANKKGSKGGVKPCVGDVGCKAPAPIQKIRKGVLPPPTKKKIPGGGGGEDPWKYNENVRELADRKGEAESSAKAKEALKKMEDEGLDEAELPDDIDDENSETTRVSTKPKDKKKIRWNIFKKKKKAEVADIASE